MLSDNKITMSGLRRLSAEDLKELVGPIGIRNNIKEAIGKLDTTDSVVSQASSRENGEFV